jgi:hypothetical protein
METFCSENFDYKFGKYFFLFCYYKVFIANAYRIESIESWQWCCNMYRIVNKAYRFSPNTNEAKIELLILNPA